MSSSQGMMTSVCDVSSDEFIKSCLPLFDGPTVMITVGEVTHQVPRALLCRHSPYFLGMFEGKFEETRSCEGVLEEKEGIVSAHSVSMFLHWLYTGHTNLVGGTAPESISAYIEFARFGDMVGIDNLGSHAAMHIEKIIVNHAPSEHQYAERNCYHLSSDHLYQASFLPEGHSVRTILAKACVENYLSGDDFKFNQEAQDWPEIGADLLRELRPVLMEMKYNGAYTEPILNETRYLQHL
ncbi:hypothetical protein BDV19DRAFT_394864 [Aspergillus venezuelensis]